MRQFDLDHSSQSSKNNRNELCRVAAVVRVNKMNCSKAIVPFMRQLCKNISYGAVMRVQLDLARAVKQEVVLASEFVKVCLQPIEVLLEVLYAEDEATVWAETGSVHHIVNCNQFRNVNRALVRQTIVGRIEVNDSDLTTKR